MILIVRNGHAAARWGLGRVSAGPARLLPVPPGERTDFQRSLLRTVGGDATPNVFATLLHNPALLDAWLPFCLKLLRHSAFPRRERELIILRTAWLCRSDYEWYSHLSIGARAGITDTEFRTLQLEPAEGAWTDRERALLQAVRELYQTQDIGEATWVRMRAELSAEQLVELPMLVGNYVLLAGVLNSLAVQPDTEEGTS